MEAEAVEPRQTADRPTMIARAQAVAGIGHELHIAAAGPSGQFFVVAWLAGVIDRD